MAESHSFQMDKANEKTLKLMDEMKLKTYRVKFFVCSDIEKVVKAKNEEDALKVAINNAIEEEPKVYWEVDENNEPEINEEVV